MARDIIRLGQEPAVRAVLLHLFQQYPQIVGFENLRHALSLDDAFGETTLRPLLSTRILELSDSGYRLTDSAFTLLQTHTELL